MGGIGLNDKVWRVFDVGGIRDLQYDRDALEGLVLEPGDAEIVKAISYRQIVRRETISVDFISGKGQGQVILLHGPPGVGKTYTVESIAGHFSRPLLSLSVADIGVKEDEMEAKLTQWFELAEIWNAVLLIDEADVFLEKRSLNSIDDSFASRIHAKIEYPKLDNEKRIKIWEAFFKKMEAEAAGRWYVSKKAKAYVLSDKNAEETQWNGREIRNAFQTAIALAEYEASEDDARPAGQMVEVTAEHFRQVTEMSLKFSKHVDKITSMTEDKRAANRRERPDVDED
ncbi:uncharacterized protein AB675_3564 [Cyphellophora attinorum]|uniref:AAA+ ATPase domain-containing protein n=1 Tax=Cyphellophora attinorum TaxID=1664694 RepID=A0A0N1H3X7_9EURO|nr:uncharacterized protein AB675_3564 [Phialophora attinorum]KPI39742.1 hypothetical protein AB675_3564 [Phialophora attinorum]